MPYMRRYILYLCRYIFVRLATDIDHEKALIITYFFGRKTKTFVFGSEFIIFIFGEIFLQETFKYTKASTKQLKVSFQITTTDQESL